MSTLTRISEKETTIEEEVVDLDSDIERENQTSADVLMSEEHDIHPASAPTLTAALLDAQRAAMATPSESRHSPLKSPAVKKPKRKERATMNSESRIPRPLAGKENPHKRRRSSVFTPLTASPLKTRETLPVEEKLRSLELTRSLISRYKPGADHSDAPPTVGKSAELRADLPEDNMEIDIAQPSADPSNRNDVASASPHLSFTYRSGSKRTSKARAKTGNPRGINGQSKLVSEYLKTLTPGQLLKRMTKSLLGSSRAPALPRSM